MYESSSKGEHCKSWTVVTMYESSSKGEHCKSCTIVAIHGYSPETYCHSDGCKTACQVASLFCVLRLPRRRCHHGLRAFKGGARQGYSSSFEVRALFRWLVTRDYPSR